MPGIKEELSMATFKDEHQKMVLNLLFTSNWLKQLDTERLAPFGISPQQYNILRILRGAKGKRMCMHEITDRMLDRAPNATRLTDKLCAKDLVLRERSEADRRVVYLLISPAGKALLDKIDKGADEQLFSVARKLSVTEARTLNSILDKLRS
ncbi:MAG: MarR family transcriptional regulator [Flavobacteriales bacterium]|jgi:MarR family 2-MHQ and catechol resistance regulon transcriptional repressor|nr:MarR family transcriptional regulator [Flavobacteriales bacterium]